MSRWRLDLIILCNALQQLFMADTPCFGAGGSSAETMWLVLPAYNSAQDVAGSDGVVCTALGHRGSLFVPPILDMWVCAGLWSLTLKQPRSYACRGLDPENPRSLIKDRLVHSYPPRLTIVEEGAGSACRTFH